MLWGTAPPLTLYSSWEIVTCTTEVDKSCMEEGRLTACRRCSQCPGIPPWRGCARPLPCAAPLPKCTGMPSPWAQPPVPPHQTHWGLQDGELERARRAFTSLKEGNKELSINPAAQKVPPLQSTWSVTCIADLNPKSLNTNCMRIPTCSITPKPKT